MFVLIRLHVVEEIYTLCLAVRTDGFGTACWSSEKILSSPASVPGECKGNHLICPRYWLSYLRVALQRQHRIK